MVIYFGHVIPYLFNRPWTSSNWFLIVPAYLLMIGINMMSTQKSSIAFFERHFFFCVYQLEPLFHECLFVFCTCSFRFRLLWELYNPENPQIGRYEPFENCYDHPFFGQSDIRPWRLGSVIVQIKINKIWTSKSLGSYNDWANSLNLLRSRNVLDRIKVKQNSLVGES